MRYRQGNFVQLPTDDLGRKGDGSAQVREGLIIEVNMADSVVRNATKEDDPIFDPSTDLGDQYLMENQNLMDLMTLVMMRLSRMLERRSVCVGSSGSGYYNSSRRIY